MDRTESKTFTIQERLKQGDLSEIFAATDEETGQTLAMKRLLPFLAENEDFRQMFAEEARLLWRMSHPNIPTLHHAAMTVELPYFLMDYIEGIDLKELLARHTLPVGVVSYLGAEVASALAYVHQMRDEKNKPLHALHREICPENIMLSREGKAFLVGFGMCRFNERMYSTRAGIIKGKFSYMSPEQIRGNPLDHRSDQFVFGVTLYETLTNQRLFQGESDFGTLELIRDAKIKPIREVRRDTPEALSEIIHKCLSIKPEGRYEDTAELQRALQSVAERELPTEQQAATLAALLVD